MASSCAALNKQAASVIVWNTEEWRISKILSFHNYTVYGLEFSPKDTYFATWYHQDLMTQTARAGW